MHFHEPGNKALCMRMSTLEENKRSFNNRQAKEVERARELMHRVEFLHEQEHKEIVSNEALKECLVTAESIKNAEKIFGNYMHEINGKTTRSKPHKATITCCDLPNEIVKKHKDAAIAVEIFFQI